MGIRIRKSALDRAAIQQKRRSGPTWGGPQPLGFGEYKPDPWSDPYMPGSRAPYSSSLLSSSRTSSPTFPDSCPSFPAPRFSANSSGKVIPREKGSWEDPPFSLAAVSEDDACECRTDLEVESETDCAASLLKSGGDVRRRL